MSFIAYIHTFIAYIHTWHLYSLYLYSLYLFFGVLRVQLPGGHGEVRRRSGGSGSGSRGGCDDLDPHSVEWEGSVRDPRDPGCWAFLSRTGWSTFIIFLVAIPLNWMQKDRRVDTNRWVNCSSILFSGWPNIVLFHCEYFFFLGGTLLVAHFCEGSIGIGIHQPRSGQDPTSWIKTLCGYKCVNSTSSKIIQESILKKNQGKCRKDPEIIWNHPEMKPVNTTRISCQQIQFKIPWNPNIL